MPNYLNHLSTTMPCHISDGPQTPEDVPGHVEEDEDAAYERERQRKIDDGPDFPDGTDAEGFPGGDKRFEEWHCPICGIVAGTCDGMDGSLMQNCPAEKET